MFEITQKKSRDSMSQHDARLRRTIAVAMIVPVVVAVMVRVSPLVTGGVRLLRQAITEDGYLMLTIARNIALGHGFSVSDGLVATNGTQPFCTLLFAGCFKIFGTDRITGLYPIVALQVLITLFGAVAIYICVKRFIYRGPDASFVALLAAMFWYISPSTTTHGHNGLETGLYAILVLLCVAMYDAFLTKFKTHFSWSRCLGLGALLGITFLARNDACFLIAAMLLFHLFMTWKAHVGKTTAIGQCVVIGLTSIVVASPWLIFNVTNFGHIVPVSGRSESSGLTFGENVLPAFVAIVENASIFLRVPQQFERNPFVIGMCIFSTCCMITLVLKRMAWFRQQFSAGFAIMAFYVIALAIYYALFFGVHFFLSRYLYSVVTLSAITMAALVAAWTRYSALSGSRIPILVVGIAAIASITLNVRVYRHGRKHMHSQVVNWVDEHVPADVWVAATQTGTLGYYHDRTINLDGKVDPQSLDYRLRGRIVDYLDERNVTYIADWAGHAVWADKPEFASRFELIVHDKQANLSVLRRREGT